MSAVAVAFAAAWTRPERRTAASRCSTSAQSDQPVATVAPAASTPVRMSRSAADRPLFSARPIQKDRARPRADRDVGHDRMQSVTEPRAAQHALGTPSEISPRTVRPAVRPRPSSASTDSSRSTRTFSCDVLISSRYPLLTRPTRKPVLAHSPRCCSAQRQRHAWTAAERRA